MRMWAPLFSSSSTPWTWLPMTMTWVEWMMEATSLSITYCLTSEEAVTAQAMYDVGMSEEEAIRSAPETIRVQKEEEERMQSGRYEGGVEGFKEAADKLMRQVEEGGNADKIQEDNLELMQEIRHHHLHVGGESFRNALREVMARLDRVLAVEGEEVAREHQGHAGAGPSGSEHLSEEEERILVRSKRLWEVFSEEVVSIEAGLTRTMPADAKEVTAELTKAFQWELGENYFSLNTENEPDPRKIWTYETGNAGVWMVAAAWLTKRPLGCAGAVSVSDRQCRAYCRERRRV